MAPHDPRNVLPAELFGGDDFAAAAAADAGYGYTQLAAATGGLDANLMTVDWARWVPTHSGGLARPVLSAPSALRGPE